MFNVVVVSTKIPKPDVKEAPAPQPFIVTVEFPTVPLDIDTTPEPFAVCVLPKVATLTIVPAPLFTSGLALGKLVSFAIGTNPPTSSTKSITLASIAAVVATFVSPADQVSPDAIVSLESCLKYLASEPAVVNIVTSSGVCAACSEAVTKTASAILPAVTASSAILAVEICESAICAVSIDPSV